MINSQSIKKIKRSELEKLILQINDSFNREQEHLLLEIKKNELINQISFEKDPDEFVHEFFKDLNLKETSTIRLVFTKSNSFSQNICFASGKSCQDFSILDDQVLDQIGEKSHLVIQDTARIHNIKFSKEHAYPRSLIAFPIILAKTKIGLVWIGDLNYQAFTKLEFENYKNIIDIYNNTLSVLATTENIKRERYAFQQIVTQDQLPIIIFNRKQKILFANDLAINQFDLTRNDREEYFSNNCDFSHFLNSSKPSKIFSIEYKEKIFEIIETIIFDKAKERIICLKFNDKTFDVEKGKYFHTIISSIIHYLKSPLIEIKEIASLISAIGDLSKKQNEFLNKIKYLIEEIQGSVSKLLSVNKIDQGNFVEINKFSINEIIENVAKIYVPLTQQKQITLNTPKSDQDQVLIDENLLKHALLNILEFSIKETHMGGTIEVIHKTDLENHYIVITDSGKGISNFDVKKLLDAKFTDQKRNELEIARGIMEILCGDLLIESNLGSGTAISLVFPWKH